MKTLLKLIFILSTDSFASFSQLPKDKAYVYEDREVRSRKVVTKKMGISKRSSNTDSLLRTIKESDQKLIDLIRQNESSLIIKKDHPKIRSLSRFKGEIVNSVMAYSTTPTVFIVKTNDKALDLEGELRCFGITYQKRVNASCNLLVTEEFEYQVDVQIWDLDGSRGLIADKYYDASEKNFLTSSVSSFFQAILHANKEMITTPYGSQNIRGSKNTALSGLSSISKNASTTLADHASENIKISFIKKNREVIIFFNKKLDLETSK